MFLFKVSVGHMRTTMTYHLLLVQCAVAQFILMTPFSLAFPSLNPSKPNSRPLTSSSKYQSSIINKIFKAPEYLSYWKRYNIDTFKSDTFPAGLTYTSGKTQPKSLLKSHYFRFPEKHSTLTGGIQTISHSKQEDHLKQDTQDMKLLDFKRTIQQGKHDDYDYNADNNDYADYENQFYNARYEAFKNSEIHPESDSYSFKYEENAPFDNKPTSSKYFYSETDSIQSDQDNHEPALGHSKTYPSYLKFESTHSNADFEHAKSHPTHLVDLVNSKSGLISSNSDHSLSKSGFTHSKTADPTYSNSEHRHSKSGSIHSKPVGPTYSNSEHSLSDNPSPVSNYTTPQTMYKNKSEARLDKMITTLEQLWSSSGLPKCPQHELTLSSLQSDIQTLRRKGTTTKTLLISILTALYAMDKEVSLILFL